eukprot:gnl/MRDRNA2_/MRDRNA2_112069_c0_seq1.p1 gnl/MRDRNA2_/MRDRNA2_112069_c0~~gnl/MRDRNA2_/MRDRNA2_112069_c0_seq1.p1  ORF type:complete len:656 (+),score=156.68 gnl/MRDRNA2_/MRDRNA2_112069_c0_seq1:111-2078(+)
MLKSSSALSFGGVSAKSGFNTESCSPLLGRKFEAVPGGWRPASSSLKADLKASASMRSLASHGGKAGKRPPRGGDQALIQALFLTSELDNFPGASASSPTPGQYLQSALGSSDQRLHRQPQASARSSIDDGHDSQGVVVDLEEKTAHRSSVVEALEPTVKREPREGSGQSPSRRQTAEQATATPMTKESTEEEAEKKGDANASKSNAKTPDGSEPHGQGYTLEELERLKEGGHGWNFKQEVFTEFAEAFIAFDKDGSKTLSPAELRPLLRSLGYVCNQRMIFELLQLAPPKNNDELDFRDYLKMIQVFTITEAEQMRQIFSKHDADQSGTINGCEIQDLLIDVGYHPTEQEITELFKEFDQDGSGTIDYGEFMIFYETYRRQERHELKRRAGFTPDEVAEIRETFEHYDKDKSGTLSRQELWRVIDDMELAPKTRDAQRRLEEAMDEADVDGSESFDFLEFLWLMRNFLEVEEHNLFLREKKAVELSQFSSQEVTEFRNVFESLAYAGEIGDITGGVGGLNAATNQSTTLTISISDVKQILRGAGVSLTTQTLAELRGIFEQFAHPTVVGPLEPTHGSKKPPENKMLDFPEFLLLISHMLTTNFANLSDSAKKTICIREKEQKNYEDLLQRVRMSVCEPFPNGESPLPSASPRAK